MKKHHRIALLLIILQIQASWAEQRVYTVYLGEHSGEKTYEEIEDHHHSFLHSVKGSREEAIASTIYSYKHIINGFSALLSPAEAAALSEMEGVVSVFHSPPGTYRLHTTRSWDFMNLLEGNGNPNYSGAQELLRKANSGKDVVVGILDSGVWPESESFNDKGMEAIPSWWKGACDPGTSFDSSHCNRKIIGARYFLKSYEAHFGPLDESVDFRSARDSDGHGTHVASTIGGRSVTEVSALGGLAQGNATGGAPLVRLAVYKVCWPVPGQTPAKGNTCSSEDVLAGFDQAIKDGVQVISVSLGGNTSIPYFEDPIAIGSLHAEKQNIVVVCAAGNEGPRSGSVANVAPWLISVGASTTDRAFLAAIELGNGVMVQGQSVTSITESKKYPLVYAGDVELPGTTTDKTSGFCNPGTLSPQLVQGKIVLCVVGSVFQALEVKNAGGVAAILGNAYRGNQIQISDNVLQETTVLQNDINIIIRYIRGTPNPVATLIAAKAVIGKSPAPVMAPFSSQGPSLIEPNILKPDITAPGWNILAAWSEAASPTNLPDDERRVKFNVASGTSMACPHVSAAAALLKAIHPDWSSAAIRSALMTTARVHNNMGTPITNAVGNAATPFEMGAGHLQLSRASDPGLIYNASFTDYQLFLCSIGYKSKDLNFNCPRNLQSRSNLNYPSLAVANLVGSVTVKRTVTNVGNSGNAEYSVTIGPPPGYSVEISPTTLKFSQVEEEKSFDVRITAQSNNATKDEFYFGWYMWSDGDHQVTSPIAVSSTESSSGNRIGEHFHNRSCQLTLLFIAFWMLLA